MAGECHNNVLYVDRAITIGVSRGDDNRGELHTDSAVRGQRGTTTPGTNSPATAVSTVALAENLQRKYLFIQNVGNGDLWFNYGIAAVTDEPSIRIERGDSFELDGNFIETRAINIIKAFGTGKYTIKEG